MISRLLFAIAVTATLSCRRDDSADKSANSAATSMADMPGMPGMSMSDTTKPGPKDLGLSAAQIAHGHVTWSAPSQVAVAGVVELPGQLVPNEDRTARLASPGDGRVITIHVSPGDRVGDNAPLVSIQSQQAGMAQSDVSKAQAEVTARQSAAAYARTARDRAERLLALKSIPRQEYERAIADDDAARAALAQAQAELTRAQAAVRQLGADTPGHIVLKSPIAGVVIAREVTPGAVVSAGAPLVTVSDVGSLWLTASIPEQFSAAARTGARLRFSVGAFARDTFTAQIQSVAGAFDPTTRALPIRAIVPNPSGRLRPEMFARVWMQSNERIQGLTVPDTAVLRMEQKPVVFVAHPDAKGGARFEKREITIGGSTGGRTTILSGLAIGDLVVTGGAYAVKAEMEKAKMGKMVM